MTPTSTPSTPTSSPAPAPRKAASRKASGKTPAKAPKAASKPAPSKTARKPAAPKKPAKTAKTPKAKKPKLVRDSYTMPKDEHAVLAELKQRCGKLGQAVKKSELLRAGLKALAAQNDKALLTALKAVPSLKTGRPKKD